AEDERRVSREDQVDPGGESQGDAAAVPGGREFRDDREAGRCAQEGNLRAAPRGAARRPAGAAERGDRRAVQGRGPSCHLVRRVRRFSRAPRRSSGPPPPFRFWAPPRPPPTPPPAPDT